CARWGWLLGFAYW
nr:immunoglobulin heavy chain junction region [Mus musculus]